MNKIVGDQDREKGCAFVRKVFLPEREDEKNEAMVKMNSDTGWAART